MSDKCDLCLLGLIFLSSLLTGINGVDDHVFISSGENVRLSCNNALHDCRSTTWNYNRFSLSAADELIGDGEKKKDIERHERLSLGSDCSLNIKNITEEDYGLYTCKQQQTNAYVFLHVLQVSSSSSSSSQTLSCQLYVYFTGFSCDDWIRSQRIEVFWVNQAGVKLKRSDSRDQILFSSDHCIIRLTTTLLNEDLYREWRCEVTHRDQVKTSVTYTVRRSVSSVVTVVSVSAAAFAALLAAVLCLIYRKRADMKRGTGQSAVKGENEHKALYETIDVLIPAAAGDHERTDDVTYSEVSSSTGKTEKSVRDGNDTVTYAAIR
ncbi:uncharacterized protein LOC122331739 [Puntigrus tetrazona]|uniref:uncharacterized protein LOC122331739 n=1 Tax=Puntigrus tetrazona TaxID=1606681 RepID=UPI001C897C9B|nr:uncharacterized protein LOC122331739 [Puntigrus tetrazona]